MIHLLSIAVGGALGSMCRYGIQKLFNTSFPLGTLLVNLIGCFLIGILWATIKEADEQKRLLLMTGFCGGFTTFSAFTLEGVQMMMAGRWFIFSFYVIVSVFVGMLATYAGYKIFNS